MINLNNYIIEAWNGVKKYTNNAEIEAWCKVNNIENYTINSKGEIDVDGEVFIDSKNFNDIELPYKFGKVGGYFNLSGCKNLISLNNCPNEVLGNFHCNGNENLVTLEGCPNELHAIFFCSGNIKLKSLNGCPKRVGEDFYCRSCGGQFDVQDVKKVCKVKGNIVV